MSSTKHNPSDIASIIHEYYRAGYDEWDRVDSHPGVQIEATENGSVLTFADSDECNAYGSHVVAADAVYTWRIQILTDWSKVYHDYSYGPRVGIVEAGFVKECSKSDSDEWCSKDRGYQLDGHWGDRNSYDSRFAEKPKGHEYIEQYCWFDEKQILEMTLDLKHRTLSFKVDDVDYGVAFKNIAPTKYRLALSMFDVENAKFVILNSPN